MDKIIHVRRPLVAAEMDVDGGAGFGAGWEGVAGFGSLLRVSRVSDGQNKDCP